MSEIVSADIPRPSRACRRRAFLAPAALLLVQAGLTLLSLPRNAVTVDEVMHLPVGMSYWHLGSFWCYHHNPPLMKLAFSLPAVFSDVPVEYARFKYVPGTRNQERELGRRFMLLNADRYMRIYVGARAVVVLFALAGGLLVYRWSSELFGRLGGTISLALWVFCPEILAHGGLVTMDMGATVLFLFASYGFREYLKTPTLVNALWCGVLLGLAEATKFSLAVLPGIWLILIVLALCSGTFRRSWGGISIRRLALHAATVCLVSLLVLNAFYFFEGTGRRLGAFDFHSKLLTGKQTEPSSIPAWDNRFRGGLLERVPVPLPEQYLLGFDDQMYDIDTVGYYKYLGGELRQGKGWWYYYLYYFAVKTPAGTLVLLGLSLLAALVLRRCRSPMIEESALWIPATVFLVILSSQTGMNFGRYALPITPFLMIFAGRLGPLVEHSRVGRALVFLGLIGSAASTVAVHPHYLAYFNEFVGGPDRGIDHLADSNLDWGQGLVELKSWLDTHARGRKVHLAYFGLMDPSVLGIDYEFTPFGRVDESSFSRKFAGPIPGLHAVSANFLVGVPFEAAYPGNGSVVAQEGAYRYFRSFKPAAIVAHSIYVYDLTKEDADRARRECGLPSLSDDQDDSQRP